MKKEFDEICTYFPRRISETLLLLDDEIKNNIQEIRLNISSPIRLRCFGENIYINSKGKSTVFDKGIGIYENELEETFFKICDNSIYTHEETLVNGFVTLRGGHRVGLCSTAIRNGKGISSIKYISSLNFRISHEFIGCSDDIMPYIFNKNNKINNCLILSAPSGGKTTILRDLCRNISKKGKIVCIIDERNEIGGNYYGKIKYDLKGCDILNNYPKDIGIIQALRTMSPDVIVCDELNTLDETERVIQGLNSGVSFIISAHASCLEEATKRETISKLFPFFNKAIFLSDCNNPGKIKRVESLC